MLSRRDALKTALSGLVAATGTSAFAGFDRTTMFGAAVRPGLIDTDADYSRKTQLPSSASASAS